MTNPDREELEKLADKLSGARDGYFTVVPKEDCQKIATALRRLASSDSGVKVKPLEWHNPRQTEDWAMAQDAYCSIGHYIASDNGWFLVGQTTWNSCHPNEAAKAAAQADYEARIRSALVEVPAVTDPWGPCGSNNGQAVLTVEDVQTILKELSQGATMRGLARLYNVDFRTIHRIKIGVCWGQTLAAAQNGGE